MGKNIQKAAPLTEEQLIERESVLKIAEQKLSDDQENFVFEKNKFEEEKSAFEIAKADLENETAEFNVAKKNLAELSLEVEKEKAYLESREKALEHNSELKSQKKSDPVSFEFEGEKYQFSESAPQSILLNGKGVSQKEIAKDDELKLQLIGGNSSLIIKK
ncbi:hypothetical protein [Chishuiella sp.]|uniref:hypothetical protein n=1 Tax=Chishuiella sp. TaxID=1969467 RepID=UPI0028AC9EDF|nr:hypothetical protein [Chishuiella sp.]